MLLRDKKTQAPFFGVYLLAAIFRYSRPFTALVRVALATVLGFVCGLAPLFGPALARPDGAAGAAKELLARLFPFNDRGLVHSYWAPNAWALYVFADRVLCKLLRIEGGGSTKPTEPEEASG